MRAPVRECGLELFAAADGVWHDLRLLPSTTMPPVIRRRRLGGDASIEARVCACLDQRHEVAAARKDTSMW